MMRIKYVAASCYTTITLHDHIQFGRIGLGDENLL